MFQEYTVLSFLLEDPLTPVDQLNSDQVITDQGSVVQSIVSLTRSLRGQLVKCFTTL